MPMDKYPCIRKDLEYFPVQQGNERLILIKDHLELVKTGKALPMALYEIMALLDGKRSPRDIQMFLMRKNGGVLVPMNEIDRLLAHLDESFLLDTGRYRKARDKAVARFNASEIRPCSHCGHAYPAEASQLTAALEKILQCQETAPTPEGNVTALIAPHIDLSVGSEVYGSAYRHLEHSSPSKVVVLGVGHHMMADLFCLTEKDFQTPFGRVGNDRGTIRKLMNAGHDIISGDDFVHKGEHSVEFQVIFLQHLLSQGSFSIIPILCGPLKGSLSEYTHKAYVEKAGPFLSMLSEVIRNDNGKTLVVAGVDLSHIGPKFGHDMPATNLEGRTKDHDQNLLKAVADGDAKAFWRESIRVNDQFNVCGFSAMACLMEVLPQATGRVLDYRLWHEEPTRSAVSFAAVVFTST